MSDRFDDLFESARSGGDKETAVLADALVAALAAGGADAPRALDVLRKLATHRLKRLRVAAAAVAAERADAAVHATLLQLAGDRDEDVREEVLDTAESLSTTLPDDVVAKLLTDDEPDFRRRAVALASGRAGLEPAVARRLREDAFWLVREAAAKALRAASPETHLPAFVEVLGTLDDEDVARECAVSAEAAIEALRDVPADVALPRPAVLRRAAAAAAQHAAGRAPRLLAWLQAAASAAVDPEELRAFGADLTAEAEAGRLPRGHRLDEAVRTVLGLLTSGDSTTTGSRSVVLLGPSGAGKSALAHEIVHRLRGDDAPGGPWRVVRVSPSDLLAGTLYLGEWQTKVRDLVQAVERPRRVLVYVPDVDQLADAGRASGSALSIGAMLVPFLEKGQVAVLGESTADAFLRASARVPGLRRVFRAVDVRPADAETTLAVLRDVRDEAGAEMSDDAIHRLVELTDFYLPGVAQPGRSVGLLRRVLDVARGAPIGVGIGVGEVLATLSAGTGIPTDLLDDRTPLDLGRVRDFFQSRVMGQPDAVDAVTDLVALVKAGLCDPGKPFGVLFFVGPTGVGKTEMARALAELIFGDAGRLVRLDMSEFASYEGFERLLGSGGDGLLTRPVHDQPFSVVLLDEIEKAHVNVYDLCLQLFDAGRLTDGGGRLVDFRRTIVILTSNAGSAVSQDAPVGFGAPEAAAPDPDDVLRDLRRLFRPEFLNRIDRIVHFRPLALESAERIARREVAHVLERSGITRRGLLVDVGQDVVALLLRAGYSRALGARPLKRTVERLVLLPVARAVATGAVVAGSALRLRARGDLVEVEVAAPETPAAAPAPDTAAAAVVRAADALTARVEGLRPLAESLAARKSEDVARAGEAATWTDRAAAQTLLDRVHRLEGLLTSWERLDRTAADLVRRARRLPASPAKGDGLARSVDAAAREAERVGALLAAGDGPALGDAIVVVTRSGAAGSALGAVERLAKMYAAFAARRGFEVEVLDDRTSDDPPEDAVALLVAGGGAFGTLAGEAGLHLFSRGKPPRRGAAPTDERDAARVEVLPAPPDGSDDGGPDGGGPGGGSPGRGVRVEARRLRAERSRLGGAFEHEARLLDERTLVSASARSGASRKDAVRRAWTILRARAGHPADASAAETVRRRYVLGPSPLVRDARSGRTSGNAERVLRGELDLVL